MTTQTERLDEAPAATAPLQSAPRWVWPVVGALCVLALVLRCVVGLGSGMWPDEAQFLFIVDEPSWGSMIGFLREHESHPPLFYALMRVWLSVTGDSDAAALALPIAFGGALVPALHAVGSRLFGWRAGLLAAAAAAVSPVLIADGAMARPYSLLPLLVLGSSYALVRGLQDGGRGPWAAHAALTLALVYTHNWGWLVVAGQWTATALCLRRGVGRPRRDVLRGWAAAQAAVAVGFLPWVPALLQQRAAAGYPPAPFFEDVHSAADFGYVAIALVVVILGSILAPPGIHLAGAVVGWTLVVAVAVLITGRRRGRGVPADVGLVVVAATPLAAIGVAFLLSQRSNLVVAHCLGVLAPLALLVIAVGLDRLRAHGQALVAAAAAVVLLVTYVLTLPPLWQRNRSNAREVAAAVAARATPSDLIVVAPWWLASTFNRYYTLPTRQIDFPATGRVGAILYDDEFARLSDPAALAAVRQGVAAQHSAGGRVWFVTDLPDYDCDATCAADVNGTSDFLELGTQRVLLLRDELARLYGPPVTCLQGEGSKVGLQRNVACLYETS